MSETTPEDSENWMRQRIRQLRNQLDEISGGQAKFGFGEDEEVPPEVELQFLEQVIGFETAPMTNWREKLDNAGYKMPPPETLNDEEVGLEVWQVIQRLSELHAYLNDTNHLSDRELYEKLWERMNQPVPDLVMGEDSAYHMEMLEAGMEADDQIWLMYYADDQTRQHWQEEFGVDLPVKSSPPYDRDHLLPQRKIPESSALQYAYNLAATAWDPKNSPMTLSSDLHPVDLESVVAVQLARILLEVLGTRGKAKATAKRGLLPRAVVKEVFESQPFPPERIHSIYYLSRQFDEEEYQRIHFVRVACQEAGLLRKHAGAFQLTQKGREMLASDRLVDLYLELMRTGFSKVNLAAFDGALELNSLQDSLPVALLRLWEEGETWVKMEDASATYLLPEPYTELMNSERPDAAALTVWLRLLRWFDDFGLIESRIEEPPKRFQFYPDAIRISALGRRLLDFD